MKLTKLSAFLLLSLLLASCSNYNYVSNLPATPCFEEAGEIQGRIGIGTGHAEFQLAASPLRYFGMTYTQFDGIKANNGTTRVWNMNLHLYHDLVPQKLFLDLSYGFGKGSILTQKWQYPSAVQSEFSYYFSSFSKQEIGINLYSKLGEEKNIQIGIGAFYRSIIYSRLGRRIEKYGTTNITTLDLTSPQERRYFSPFFYVKISPPNASYLSFSQTLSLDKNLGNDYFYGNLTDTYLGINGPQTSSTHVFYKSINSTFLYAITIGLNLNAYKQIKNCFHK